MGTAPQACGAGAGWVSRPGASPAFLLAGRRAPRPPGATLDRAAGRPWRGQGRPEGVAQRREYRTVGRNGPPLTPEGPGRYPPSCQQIGRAGWVQGPSRQARQGPSRPIRAPARTPPTARIGQRDRRRESLARVVHRHEGGCATCEPSSGGWRWSWRRGCWPGCCFGRVPAAAPELALDPPPPREPSRVGGPGHRPPFPGDRRAGTLTGTVAVPGVGVVGVDAVAGLVVLVALPVSIALFGWLLYRLLRPGRRP
jgi:hypothetical protein